MEIRINRKFCNKNPHFPIINQGNENETRMFCTIYAPYITWYWNSGISLGNTEEEVEKEIKRIAKQQIDKGLLSKTEGGKGSDGVEAWEREHKVNVIKLNKWQDRNLIKEILSKGLALTIGIRVDVDFLIDSDDGILDGKWSEYINDKSKFGHFTTLVGSNTDVINFEGGYKYAIVDSYAWNKKGRDWVYKFNDIDGFLDFISMNTIYLIW